MTYVGIKRLPPEESRSLDEINWGREKAGLKALAIKVRTCILCRGQFESLGLRTCGCGENAGTLLNGQEVL